jgi:CheY-like chemotaxis protein
MNKVEFCITGLEAVNKIKEGYRNGETYRLILTDFMMPIMNGIEATRNIREFLHREKRIDAKEQPRIIGVTAHCIDKYVIDAKSQGMDEVYGKPLYYQ